MKRFAKIETAKRFMVAPCLPGSALQRSRQLMRTAMPINDRKERTYRKPSASVMASARMADDISMISQREAATYLKSLRCRDRSHHWLLRGAFRRPQHGCGRGRGCNPAGHGDQHEHQPLEQTRRVNPHASGIGHN